MKVLVSACLLGENCKYNGGNNENAAVLEYLKDKTVLPVCPETLAGLGTPRVPMELCHGVLTDREGTVREGPVRQAVAQILERLDGVQAAVLKARSPTCGVHEIYDGTFTGRRVPGRGLLAAALAEAGVPVMDEEDLETAADI